MDESPAMRVLTNAALFRRIAACTTGWPLPVLQLFSPRARASNAANKKSGRANFPTLGRIVEAAVVAGDTNVLERIQCLRVSAPYYRDHSALQLDGIAACAVWHQQLDVLAWLRERMMYDLTAVWGNRSLLAIAIDALEPPLSGDTRLLDWLDANYSRKHVRIGLPMLLTLARTGRLELIQWLHAHDGAAQFTPDVMDAAAANGHLAVVKFLHEHRREGCTTKAMDTSVRVGNLTIAAYLHEHRTEGCSLSAMPLAAGSGRLESVQFLHAIHPEPFSTDAMDEAAANGHLSIVQFLHEHRSDGCTQTAIDAAARRGYHHVVEFLCRNRSEGCLSTTLTDAAARGFACTVRVLCMYSQQGCLVAAHKRAQRRNFTEVLDVLQEFIASDAGECNESLHGERGPRRCQRRAQTQEAAAMTPAARIRDASE